MFTTAMAAHVQCRLSRCSAGNLHIRVGILLLQKQMHRAPSCTVFNLRPQQIHTGDMMACTKINERIRTVGMQIVAACATCATDPPSIATHVLSVELCPDL